MNSISDTTSNMVYQTGAISEHQVNGVASYPLEYWRAIAGNNSVFDVDTKLNTNDIYRNMPHLLLSEDAKVSLIKDLHKHLTSKPIELDTEIAQLVDENFEDLIWT